MAQSKYNLAQVNIARMRAPLDSDTMADFVARLDDINALADSSPGFVWRYQTEEGNATSLRAYDDESILFNLSVWRSPEELQAYVYKSSHVDVMRRRREWFEKFEGLYYALWWVPAGHIPTVAEARSRLEHLRTNGESAFAFSFRHLYPAPDAETEQRALPPLACPAWGT
jgi:hypothetical protein